MIGSGCGARTGREWKAQPESRETAPELEGVQVASQSPKEILRCNCLVLMVLGLYAFLFT